MGKLADAYKMATNNEETDLANSLLNNIAIIDDVSLSKAKVQEAEERKVNKQVQIHNKQTRREEIEIKQKEDFGMEF